MYSISKKLIPLSFLCFYVESVFSAHLYLNEGNENEICSSIFSNVLRNDIGSLHEAISASGGNYDYTKWRKLKGSNQINSYNLEYSVLDLDGNGEKDVIVKGFKGCGGYQPFYRVIESQHLTEDGVTDLSVQGIWASDGVGWCFGSQYEHYGIPFSYDLRSFEYDGVIYLTLESYRFGAKGHEANSFIVAEYTGIMDTPKTEQEVRDATDRLKLVCRFSYENSGSTNQAGGTR